MQHDEDPVAHASARAGQMLAALMAGAEAYAQLAQLRAQQRAERDQGRAQTAAAELRARLAADRLRYDPLFEHKTREAMSVPEVVDAWSAARGWPDDLYARDATRIAEDRLRDLRPEAMRTYDEAVSRGVDRGQAMTDAAWLLEREPARFVGDPGPVRPELDAGPDADVDDLATRRAHLDAAADAGEAMPDMVVPAVDASRIIEGESTVISTETMPDRCYPGDLLLTAETVAGAVGSEVAAGQLVEVGQALTASR